MIPTLGCVYRGYDETRVVLLKASILSQKKESQMMSQFLSWLPRETYQVAVFIILSASKI